MKEKSYLGIFGPGPNSSAALVSRNEIIAWVEEERFNRIKLAPNTYPMEGASTKLAPAGIRTSAHFLSIQLKASPLAKEVRS